MNEQRLTQYLNLIQSLLNCPQGEEPAILQANQELIDEGLTQSLLDEAANLTKKGDFNNANRLMNIAGGLLGVYSDQPTAATAAFVQELLQAEYQIYKEGKDNPQVIHHLLADNPDKLDENFAPILLKIATDIIAAKTEATKTMPALIGNLCLHISDFPLGNIANNTEIAIAGHKFVLQYFQEGTKDWAQTQNSLGLVYTQRIQGDTAENLEMAIAAFQYALLFYTKNALPKDWAMTQNNLGVAYRDRIKGDTAENVELAIAAFQNALLVRTKEAFPAGWAGTQHNLGTAYSDRIQGDTAENLEKAIAAYKKALEVYTTDTFPNLWALTQNSLGNAYRNRILGDTAENLEKAIAAYKKALLFYTKDALPKDWAMAQNNLGLAYSDRIKGDRAENIEKAIAVYQKALEVYTKEAFPTYWATTQNNLGATYSNRIQGDTAENLEKAIAACQKALEVYTKDAFPNLWATTQNNLGNAYLKRIQGDTAENLEMTIAAYQNALEIRTKEALPKDWAMAQNNLGLAYINRIKGDTAENLEMAIAACQKALLVCTKDAFPRYWAGTQNSLGNAYRDRIKGDRAENLEIAIAAFQNALLFYTKDALPNDWAKTQNNLGNAYLYRIQGDRAENLENAIAAYESALKVYTKEALPNDWAETQNSLGAAYLYRIQGDRAENLEMAIAAFQNALLVRTKETLPNDWAKTQSNLGIAYRNRIQGDRAESLEMAIAAFQNALEEALPKDWATTQNNLGNAYSDAGNQKEAIQAYRLALTERTPKTLPLDCLQTARQLGNLGFQQGDWQLAIEGYEQAIQAVEQTRNWISDETRRQEVLRKSIYIFENAIQAYINNQQLEKALETVERFRCKRLVDLMATKDLYADGNLPPEVAEYVRKYQAKQQQIDQLRSQLQSGGEGDDKAKARSYRTRDEWEEINENIDKLTAEKQQIWKQLRSLDPVLAEGKEVPPLDVGKMRQLLGDDGEVALVSFYTTDDDTLIFILRQDTLQLHTCQGQGLEELQLWLRDNWFLPYAEIDSQPGFLAAAELLGCPVEELQSVTTESKQVIGLLADGSRQSIDKSQFQQLRKQKKQQLREDWQNRMEEILAALAKRLQLEELVEKLSGVKELILVPFMYLHQIPLAALPVGEPDKGEYWGGKFSIRTIASSQVLDFCSQREQLKQRPTYGIVENPTEDLTFTPIECELVAKLYEVEPHNHLKNAAATKEKYRQLLIGEKIQGLLSSHHAKSNLTEPLDSALLLADGKLTLGELLSLRFPELKELFLSCCETGLGNAILTDDIFTLAAGFLCAGAINVISSLWSVDDLATAILSYFYHKNRLDGLNRPQALWQAQMNLKNLTEEEALASLEDAEAVLEELEKGCQEYDFWEKEADCRHRVYNLVAGAKQFLGGEKPFDRPCYWSGFLCQGLR